MFEAVNENWQKSRLSGSSSLGTATIFNVYQNEWGILAQYTLRKMYDLKKNKLLIFSELIALSSPEKIKDHRNPRKATILRLYMLSEPKKHPDDTLFGTTYEPS